MVLPLPGAWPGGLPCPWNRGTVDAVACRETIRGKRWSQRSRPWIRLPSGLGSGAGLVGGACGWGSGMPSTVRPDPSTLDVVGERGSRHEGRSPARFRPVAVSLTPPCLDPLLPGLGCRLDGLKDELGRGLGLGHERDV